LVQSYYEIDIRVQRKAETLVEAGYSVDVLALRSDYSPGRSYSVNGVNVHTIALGKKRGSLFRYIFEYFAFFTWAFFKVCALTKHRRYAVVDANNLPDFLVFAGAYAKWKGARIVFDMHEITPEFYISKYRISESSWLVSMLKWIERLSMAYSDHVMTINEPIQQLLQRRGLTAGKSTIIMNSADEALFASAISTASPPAIPDGRSRFVMMYHGTVTRIYGLDIAIAALALAQQQTSNAELWIVGDGPETARLQRQAHELGVGPKVKFLGRVLPEEIPGLLRQCDIGVLPTRQDVFLDFSFSNKLSEYVLLGKPVIASRLRTLRHYFSEEALAFFTPENPADLARQMCRLYQDAELRRRMGKQAAAEYAPISWSVMKERYLAMMERLTSPKTVAESQQAATSLVNR
jgi:glycosyltransferase involved in cell wall biosynthesis